MTEFSQKEWADKIKLILIRLGLKQTDLALIMGDTRFYISHLFSGIRNVTSERMILYKNIIPFLEKVLLRDGPFKKSVREPARVAVMRRMKYAYALNKEFGQYIETLLKQDRDDAAKTVTE